MANDIENDAANFLTFIQGLWLNHFLYIFILFLRFFYCLSLCSRHVEKLLKACRNLLFSRREIEPLYLDWDKKSKRVVPSYLFKFFKWIFLETSERNCIEKFMKQNVPLQVAINHPRQFVVSKCGSSDEYPRLLQTSNKRV